MADMNTITMTLITTFTPNPKEDHQSIPNQLFIICGNRAIQGIAIQLRVVERVILANKSNTKPNCGNRAIQGIAIQLRMVGTGG